MVMSRYQSIRKVVTLQKDEPKSGGMELRILRVLRTLIPVNYRLTGNLNTLYELRQFGQARN
jgi:hypothetical protein